MSLKLQKILALDASTSHASVAVFKDGELYEERIEAISLHAQHLLPMIERLLTKANLTPKALDGIVFGRGPGSFTGLRIACSVAKGLAYAHNLPLYPISGLAAIAMHVFQTASLSSYPVLAAIDARMNQLYWAYYPVMTFQATEQVTQPEQLELPSKQPFVLAGVGLDLYQAMLPPTLLEQVVSNIEVFPSARALISIVQTIEVPAVSAIDALPIYVRNQVTHGGGNG